MGRWATVIAESIKENAGWHCYGSLPVAPLVYMLVMIGEPIPVVYIEQKL